MIPSTLQVGLTWEWDASFSDYPASTHTLVYTLINSSNKISITASADDDDYTVAVATATTEAYSAGVYSYQATVTDGTDTFLVASGEITVNPSFSAATTYDNRTHAKKVLDAIEATLEGKASQDQQMIMIGGRQITTFSPDQLLSFRDAYRAEYKAEQVAAGIAAGNGNSRKIKVKFV